HTSESVEVPGKTPIDDERNRIQRSAAATGDSAGASPGRIGTVADDEAVLVFMVIGEGQIKILRGRVSRTNPGRLQNLVGGEVVVGRSKDGVAALDERAGSQRI